MLKCPFSRLKDGVHSAHNRHVNDALSSVTFWRSSTFKKVPLITFHDNSEADSGFPLPEGVPTLYILTYVPKKNTIRFTWRKLSQQSARIFRAEGSFPKFKNKPLRDITTHTNTNTEIVSNSNTFWNDLTENYENCSNLIVVNKTKITLDILKALYAKCASFENLLGLLEFFSKHHITNIFAINYHYTAYNTNRPMFISIIIIGKQRELYLNIIITCLIVNSTWVISKKIKLPLWHLFLCAIYLLYNNVN